MEEDIKKAASAFGRMGGTARYNKYGKEAMREMQRRGVEARKRNKANKLGVDNNN